MSTNKDISLMFQKLEKIRDKLTSKDSMEDTGEFAANLIRKRTRDGFGVSEHGASKKKLDKLSPKYIKSRKKNKPSGPSTPSKSNLTYSGDMLDDLTHKKAKKGSVEIGFKSDESADKAEWVSDDRPFNHLSKSEQKQILAFLDKKAKKTTNK